MLLVRILGNVGTCTVLSHNEHKKADPIDNFLGTR